MLESDKRTTAFPDREVGGLSLATFRHPSQLVAEACPSPPRLCLPPGGLVSFLLCFPPKSPTERSGSQAPSFPSRLFPGHSALLNQKSHQDVSETEGLPGPRGPPQATRTTRRNETPVVLNWSQAEFLSKASFPSNAVLQQKGDGRSGLLPWLGTRAHTRMRTHTRH